MPGSLTALILVALAVAANGVPAAAAGVSRTVSPPNGLAFEAVFGGWDGRIHRVTLPTGGVVLGWPGRAVRVAVRAPSGWTAEPLFAAHRRGRGTATSWEVTGRDGEESRALRFRLRGPRGVAEAGIVLLLPIRVAPDRDGLVRGPGWVFPLGHYPDDVPARFRDRARAWSNRLYVIRDTASPISRHFTLGMFVSKARPGRPLTPGIHLLALDFTLVDALERVQEAWTRTGRPGLVRVESPFRTPDYNNADEAGRATFSQHMYGSAVDILVSTDTDRLHDDIDGDGDRDLDDVLPLARLVKRLMKSREIPTGGIGVYEYVYRDGRPGELTVHLDIRGTLATWGQLYDSDTVHPAGRIRWE